MTSTRYTLSLPTVIYDELRQHAEARGMTIKEVVRQCLRFGLIALKTDDDPNVDIVIRERIPNQLKSDEETVRESLIQFL